jgi:hypothetical protein
MKIHATLILALALGIVIAPVLLGAGAAQSGAGARIVFYVA